MATEQDALDIMEFLEAEPTPNSAGLASLVTPGNDIPAKREKLAVLVSTGKAKEAVGVQLTHDQVKRLSDKEVEKYHKRQEAYIGSKTTESLIDSLLMLFSKGLGMVVKVDDIEKTAPRPQERLHHQPRALLAGGWRCFELSGAGWPWPMPPSSRLNTCNLRRNLGPT